MSLNTKMHTGVTRIYMKHNKSMREAHSKLLNLEKVYKVRLAKDNTIVIDKILKIVEDVVNDN